MSAGSILYLPNKCAQLTHLAWRRLPDVLQEFACTVLPASPSFCRWSCLTNSANIFPFIAFAIYLLPIKGTYNT